MSTKRLSQDVDVKYRYPLPRARINWYTFNCAMFAAVGSLLYGFASGIISTTIAQTAFLAYFSPYTEDVAGAVVSTFGAGNFFGVLFAGWAADAWGRKRTIQFAAAWGLAAGAIQAGSIHVGMLIVGRILGGFSVGIMNMTIPIYNSEIAPPSRRGLIAGLHAQFLSFGFAAANWVGFACSYAEGGFQWRFPLAVQCIPAIFLIAGISFLPFSPRWLLEKGRDDEALAVFKKLSSASNGSAQPEGVYLSEFNQMRKQIQHEKATTVKSITQLFKTKSARKRVILAILVQVFAELSGVNVVNYYQTLLYRSVGITGHTITLLAGGYGMVGVFANAVCLLFVDRWGRKPIMWTTGLMMACDMAIIMGLTAGFAGGSNKIGQGFTIAFIFCFSMIYSLGYNSIHFIYVPEILSQAIRARGSAVAICCNVLANITLNQIAPRAFESIGYKYYAVFVGTNLLGAIVVFLYFPETKDKSLEEINILFGDELIETRKIHEMQDDGLDSQDKGKEYIIQN